MRKIDELLAEYGESHKNSTNKAIHWICVPAIFFSIVALLWAIPSNAFSLIGDSDFFNWATLTLVAVMIYYLRLSLYLAVGMLFFSILCLLLANYLDQNFETPLWQFALVIFVLAWIGQFYGHKIEGKKPSFLKDLQFLLIGPAWLMHFIYKKLKITY